MGHIFLYGPVGAGKSTVGKILARNLNLPFVDLDEVIEADAGMTIFQLMQQKGEAACRDRETTALKQITNENEKESVIALGGGALLREENRALVETNGQIVFLAAEINTLLRRLNSDSNKRPLLAGDLHDKLTELLARRKQHYDSFPVRLDADQPPEKLAWQIQVALGRFRLRAMGEYDVVIEGVEQLGGLLDQRGVQNPILVTDANVATFHAERIIETLRAVGFHPASLIVPPGEAYKTLDTVQQLWHGFLEHGLDRRSTVIALGGGVIGDLAGFAASTYMRGIRWVGAPTTLLAMVDASLGGKTGFDLPEGKNLIGSFYPPRLVLADPQMLKTLPDAEFISGLAEVVKHGILSDPELFDLCARGLDCVRDNLEHIVKRAMAVKIQVIEEDPYERGIRAALNLGHTVGHAGCDTGKRWRSAWWRRRDWQNGSPSQTGVYRT
jgi:shikimate kinase